MKSVFEKLTQSPEEGFVFKSLKGKACNCPWHFHPEYELILMLDGFGYRIIGDNISSLAPGDIVLIGANLPHVYKYDNYPGKTRCQARCLLIQFDRSIWQSLLQFPVFTPARQMLDNAAFGLHVTGKSRDKVDGLMRKMPTVCGIGRVALFIEILEAMSCFKECRPISSSTFSAPVDKYKEQRVNRVCRYIHENIHHRISIAQAARVANLSEGAFSRFFHLHLGKTFPAVVNELRVGRACQLLAETDMPITQVAMSCGYGNLSNFNRQFLKLKGITPREFRTRISASS